MRQMTLLEKTSQTIPSDYLRGLYCTFIILLLQHQRPQHTAAYNPGIGLERLIIIVISTPKDT